MAWAPELRVVDPLGADVRLWDLYPMPFEPADLGEAACQPGTVAWPGLALGPDAGHDPPAVRDALLRAGSLAHAPYSNEPAAVVLRMVDGRLVTGSVLESVAFNPTVGPLQDALVAVVAAGLPLDAIEAGWLGTVAGARVAHEAATRELLAAVAPGASLGVRYWA
jgi:cytidine deaminase